MSFQAQAQGDEKYLELCPELEREFEVNNEHGLSEGEMYALFWYTLKGAYILTPALETDDLSKLDACALMSINYIDSALEKIPDSKVVVYRGTNKKHKKVAIGEVVSFKSFKSTTDKREFAENFIEDRLWVMELQNGKDISQYSGASKEGEYLVPRDSKFLVTDIQSEIYEVFPEDGSPIYEIDLEVVNAEQVTE